MINRIALIVALALPGAVFGQSINVDLDTPGPPEGGGGVPSSSFGAAANQPGVWNSVSVIGQASWLFDLNGVVRPVTITLGSSAPALSGGGFNNPANTGDFSRLLNDAANIDDVWRSWTFNGLLNGTYRVTTYTVRPSPEFTQAFVTVSNSISPNPQVVQGIMPGNQFILGRTHSVHLATVSNGTLTIHV